MATLQESILGSGKWLALKKRGQFEFVERVRSSGVVVIYPVTDKNEVVLVEQWREAVKKNCIELPAGLVGDEAHFSEETFLDAAKRELVEETGFESSKMTHVSEFGTSTGITAETVHLYFAEKLRLVSAGGGDETERITVHCVPENTLVAWLDRKQAEGFMIDYKIFAAAYLFSKKS